LQCKLSGGVVFVSVDQTQCEATATVLNQVIQRWVPSFVFAGNIALRNIGVVQSNTPLSFDDQKQYVFNQHEPIVNVCACA
jgi:hypothetical protein